LGEWDTISIVLKKNKNVVARALWVITCKNMEIHTLKKVVCVEVGYSLGRNVHKA
jgi:hypothetical protein